MLGVLLISTTARNSETLPKAWGYNNFLRTSISINIKDPVEQSGPLTINLIFLRLDFQAHILTYYLEQLAQFINLYKSQFLKLQKINMHGRILIRTTNSTWVATMSWSCQQGSISHFPYYPNYNSSNYNSILKNRGITLPTKVHIVKALVFAVVMYGCESWTIKKAECWRIDAFELWCWKRLLRVPWTARRSNQSILKEISSEYSWMDWCWSWHSNTLATWCKYLTHLKRPWCWRRLKTGREGDDREWEGWMTSLTQQMWVWARSRRWWRTGKLGVLQSMGSQRVRHD